MLLSENYIQNSLILTPQKSLSHMRLQEVSRRLWQEVENPSTHRIILNCEHVSLIDSPILKLFMDAFHTLKRQQRKLIFCELNESLQSLFHESHLDSMLLIAPNVDEALKL